MFKKYYFGMMGALLAFPMLSIADEAKDAGLLKSKTPEAIISERLQQARPEIQFSDPRPSAIKGLYQVQVTGGPVLYVTPEGDKFIAGEIFSIDERGFSRFEDPFVVEERKRRLASIDPKDTIIFKPKKETKAVVYVFTDVDCGYCRLLHRQIHTYEDKGQKMPGYNDLGIEIRYLAYPRAGIPSASADKLITAWCSKDQQGALTALKNDQSISPVSCDKNPVAADFKLGAEVGVNGTPALWFPDGRLMPGYLPPEQLAQALGIN